MADYFTRFSFVVNGTPEQLKWLADLHDQVCRNASVAEPAEPTPQSTEIERVAYDIATNFEGDTALTVRGNAIYSNEYGNAEYAATLIIEWLDHFDISKGVGFTWASWCSCPRADSFTGGACYVTKDGATWHVAEHWLWLEQQARAPAAA